MAKVVREYPDAVFYIAGSHDPVDEGGSSVLKDLQNLARELGVSDQVIFGGWQNDMPSVLAAFDIFVHCPTTFIEGLPIACLEAMACGKPTIVSENGGLPDAVVEGVTGFIVPPGDIDALRKPFSGCCATPNWPGAWAAPAGSVSKKNLRSGRS